ncbi:cupin domain-containing protein [Candidatus Uhrbacteria bacterium CG_4_10_14_0_8_um_filter_58_22]|uniref:Cupin domain-containing protein n=1 Tax=Candidatus Uhrbacteria bacterium CG_4_10_14_0_8_um_filter_58_22 TaxID=1975029 RepID=A0A2M7Q9K6_9BACT|nr:MAG: cupin [Parcubacteria group bacterium CG1_02_58_44]PIY61727.1 MAG: cupin domain-containing protein [Candidatus Uhrbacteria bacterium CG_4_10_14_0_8_um_filter_58_22]
MKGFSVDLEKRTLENEFFRQVLFTTERSQLVLMALQPSENIGLEVHEDRDQFIRVEAGQGRAIIGGEEFVLEDGSAVVIPAGSEHDIINGPEGVMKLYTLYTPPEHQDGTVHKTKEEALAAHH